NEAGSWQVTADGRYHAAAPNNNPPAVSTVKNRSFSSFVVEVDVQSGQDGGVVVRFQNLDNFVICVVSPDRDQLYWHVRQDGDWGPPRSVTALNMAGPGDLHLQVYNSGTFFHVRVFQNGQPISHTWLGTSEFGSNFWPTGGVGLYDFGREQT